MTSANQTSHLLEGLLFPRIFRSFRMAIQPSKLIIAFVLIAAIGLTGWLMDFTGTVVTTPGTNSRETELNLYMVSPQRVPSYIERYSGDGLHRGVFSTMWGFGRDRFHETIGEIFALNLPAVFQTVDECLTATKWAIKYHTIYCIIFGLITLSLVSAAGGAICRIAALQFARDEKPGITEALRFSLMRFKSFFTTPLVPVAIVALIGIGIFLLGLLGNIPMGLGEVIVGISMPLALAAGAIIAVILIGAIAGFNLMFPAVAYDGTDGLDAVSRSFNYVYAKPWRMGFYTATAVFYGAVCYVFVRFFAFLLLWSTHLGLRLGLWRHSARGVTDKLSAIWPEPSFAQLAVYSTDAVSRPESIAAFLVYLSTLVIVGLLVSYIISFYFSANTVIYALLRNRVDNTPIEQIYTAPEEKVSQPTLSEVEGPA